MNEENGARASLSLAEALRIVVVGPLRPVALVLVAVSLLCIIVAVWVGAVAALPPRGARTLGPKERVMLTCTNAHPRLGACGSTWWRVVEEVQVTDVHAVAFGSGSGFPVVDQTRRRLVCGTCGARPATGPTA